MLTSERLAQGDGLELVREHVRSARYDAALELLEGCEDWESPQNEAGVLLRAEVLIRRNPIAGLQELIRFSDVFETPAGIFDAELLRGKAYANSRDFDNAAATFAAARKKLDPSNSEMAAQLALQEARLEWLTQKFDPSTPTLTLPLASPLPALRMAALALRAWMHAGLEQFEEQIQDFIAALCVADENPGTCDAAAVGNIIHPLLGVAFELAHLEGIAAGEQAYEALEWTQDIRLSRFQAVRTLAWHAFLQNQSGKAQWLFKDSKTFAPSRAWEVMAHVDRAYVARMNLNEAWALDEIAEAQRLAEDVTWNATEDEERFALVTLALAVAPMDLVKAQGYISTYTRIGTESVNPTLAMTHDRRAIAFGKYGQGRVQQVMGNTELAVLSLQAAYDIFEETDHHYRAAVAAASLFEVTGDPAWRDRARTQAARFPESPLRQRLHDGHVESADEIYDAMVPLQRQVARALCEGLGPEEMSRRLSRSVFTLRRHIDAVYLAFGVKSRNELRAEMGRRGIV